VRAADASTTLNSPQGVSARAVLDSIRATPADRDRLIYMIHNGQIAKKSNGWIWERYTGSDPHDTHFHLSGDPAYDEDGAPWQSILKFGDDMDANQSRMLECVFYMTRMMFWKWFPSRQAFIDAGGPAAVWDAFGGMGDHYAGTAMFARDDAGNLYTVEAGMSSPIAADRLDDAAYVMGQRGVKLMGPRDGKTSAEWVQVTSGSGKFWVRTGWTADVFGLPLSVELDGISEQIEEVNVPAPDPVDQETVLAALESERGQAAMVRANETSEDS
jgi:hypothetical protein